jgi:hypothetical protein
MDFSEALIELRKQKRVNRTGWNGKGMYIQLLFHSSEMDLPYIYMKTADNKKVPWLASQTDILASDWEITCLHTQLGTSNTVGHDICLDCFKVVPRPLVIYKQNVS